MDYPLGKYYIEFRDRHNKRWIKKSIAYTMKYTVEDVLKRYYGFEHYDCNEYRRPVDDGYIRAFIRHKDDEYE